VGISKIVSSCSWTKSLSASPGLDIIPKCTHFPLVAHYIVCYINVRVTSGGKVLPRSSSAHYCVAYLKHNQSVDSITLTHGQFAVGSSCFILFIFDNFLLLLLVSCLRCQYPNIQAMFVAKLCVVCKEI